LKDYDRVVLAIAWTPATQGCADEERRNGINKGSLVRLPATKDEHRKPIPAMDVMLFEDARDSSSDSETDSLGLDLAQNLKIGA